MFLTPQDGIPKRPKITPRRVQYYIGVGIFACLFFASIFDRLGVDFGAILGAKMVPQGWHQTRVWSVLGGPRRSWGRLCSALLSSCGSGSLFELSWAPLEVILGCSWDHFWPLGSFFFGSFRSLGCLHVRRPSKIDEVIPIRPCGLRAARSAARPLGRSRACT